MFSHTDRKIDDGAVRGPKDDDRNRNAGFSGGAELIGHFKSDHASLLEMLHGIEDHLMHGHLAVIPALLDGFRNRLQAHLAEEDEKFYAPLQTLASHDAAMRQVVEQAEARMMGIARVVLVFAKGYIESGIKPQNREQFGRDLDTIESLLSDRIKTEETALYPLCDPE